jgi:hypothetical protein
LYEAAQSFALWDTSEPTRNIVEAQKCHNNKSQEYARLQDAARDRKSHGQMYLPRQCGSNIPMERCTTAINRNPTRGITVFQAKAYSQIVAT